ncbi:aldehyde dehydrogenase family protein [Nitrosomonas sp.]|uniref:aldehyde dehydrogenase family protein n=1 Tax=Nitrosomonas sp. TaxID=42353 RepID=UPI002849DB90|nr:aldehyde dehydrogenase family protein [Nitrosomonas sp.]MDR4513816.1 aldehyde dehydrogenase family protein [Nitrosomonas sp.]
MTEIQKTISPIDGSVYAERALASREQIDAAFAMAKQAQAGWCSTPLEERKALCSRAVEAFVANKAVIAEELCWQMGRPIRYAANEVRSFADRARYMISIADDALAPVQTSDKPGFIRYIKREPVGTVLVIAPWNYPLHTPINSIIPALLAGNTVILKHSAQTPLCAERIVEAFEQAGVPEGVFQYLHMSHAGVEDAIQSGQIDFIAFTGSVAVGARIEQLAAGRFIGVGLELGGKDPSYIRADADLDYAVENTVDGAFFNSGQSCCGIERIYVHTSVYEPYVEQFVDLVRQYRLGRSDDPETTLGPLVNARAAAFVRDQVNQAVAQGAVAHVDPSNFPLDRVDTPYMAPQVLTEVNHGMRVMTEETFGPVVGIMKVDSDAQAVALMNDSVYGLTASVFTRDIETAVTLGRQIETGTFFVNRCDYLDPELAWTGVKNTGRGCTLSKLGFNAFTRPKSFHIKIVS